MKKLMLTVAALALLSAPVLAEDRGGTGPASVSEKSSKSEPASKGDCRDALYAKFGSKGIDYKKADPAKVAWVLKKCQGNCKPTVKKVSSLY